MRNFWNWSHDDFQYGIYSIYSITLFTQLIISYSLNLVIRLVGNQASWKLGQKQNYLSFSYYKILSSINCWYFYTNGIYILIYIIIFHRLFKFSLYFLIYFLYLRLNSYDNIQFLAEIGKELTLDFKVKIFRNRIQLLMYCL